MPTNNCNSMGKIVKATCTKLSGYIGNGAEIMLLSMTGGSTVQWGTGRSLLCLAALVTDVLRLTCEASAVDLLDD